MKKQHVIKSLTDPGVVPVVRLNSGEKLPPLLEALADGGIRAVELTMTIPGATTLLRENCRRFEGTLLLGMGTVTDRAAAMASLEAGAQFLVSPFPVPEVLEEAKRADVPMIAGAFSPWEVFQADRLGADFVKVFPFNCFGLTYLRDLQGPLPGVKFFPTGGITLADIPSLFRLVAGCGVGGALVRQKFIHDGRWKELTALAEQFVAAARQGRGA